jgi:hypothetical protein
MLLVGAGAAVYFSLAPRGPADQRLRIVLGNEAPRVEGVGVRCAQEGGNDGEWVREVTFHYAKGKAPRIVSYEPRLASGPYLLEIEVETDDGHVETTDRHIQLAGGTTSIDLAVAPRAR